MKKMLKRLCTGFLALATVVTALPTTPVHAESKQYWTESKERVGIVEKVMNDGSIGSTFNEGHLTVEARTLTVSTSTQILRMVTRPELTQAPYECRPDKRRCLIYRICETVHRQPQRNKQQSRLPFKTACCLAEIERTSWLAM